MAAHLQNKGGHHVTVYNRTRAKAEAWVAKHGGRLAATPAEAAGGQDFVFACVGNDDDLRAVTIGRERRLAGMERGAIFIDHTTASAEVARELGRKRRRARRRLPRRAGLRRPGRRRERRADRDGAAATRPTSTAKPVIDAYARMVGLMGPVGAGQLTKMINQICIAGLVQGLAEGHPLRQAGRPRYREGHRGDLQGRCRLVADGKPPQDHGCRQIRFRLCRRLDAQGSRHLPRRSRPQRRPLAGHRAGRPVLQARSRRWAASAGTPHPCWRGWRNRTPASERSDGTVGLIGQSSPTSLVEHHVVERQFRRVLDLLHGEGRRRRRGSRSWRSAACRRRHRRRYPAPRPAADNRHRRSCDRIQPLPGIPDHFGKALQPFDRCGELVRIETKTVTLVLTLTGSRSATRRG